MEDEYNHAPNDREKLDYSLTSIELKHRLKHIAGLCYSLCIDISKSEIEAEYLRMENKLLRQFIAEKGLNAPHMKRKIEEFLRRNRRSDD